MKKKNLLAKALLLSATAIMTFSAFGISANAAEVTENGSAVNKDVTITTNSDANEDKSVLPASYSSRDMGFVTPIKAQTANNCWAFGSVEMFETLLMSNSVSSPILDAITLDKWGTKRADGTGWQREEGTGSFTNIPMGNFISNQGPYYISDGNSEKLNYYATSIEYINKNTPQRTKELIYNYGSVGGSYHHDNKYLSNDSLNYYCYDTGISQINGHFVSVVGWDDNYSKENFAECGKTPENNGAWLVRNSWGNYNSNGGYFWMSYEDTMMFETSFSESYAITGYREDNEYNNIYQNETDGSTYDFSYIGGTDDITYINKYDFSDGFDALDNVVFESISQGSDYRVYYVPIVNDAPDMDKSHWTFLNSGVIEHSGYINVDTNDFALPLGYGGIAVTISNARLAEQGESYMKNMIGVNEWLQQAQTKELIFLNKSNYGESYVAIDDEVMDLMEFYKEFLDDDIGATAVIKANTTNSTQQEPKVTLLGDADLDNYLTISDTTTIQQYCASILKFSKIRSLNADFNNDGIIDVKDATDIQIALAS